MSRSVEGSNAVAEAPAKDTPQSEVTLADLRASNHPALERIAKRAAENMRSSAYTSHHSHYSAHE